MAFPRWYLQAPGCWPPDAQEHMKFAVHVCVLHARVHYLPAECFSVPVRLFPSVWKMVTALPCWPEPRGLDTRQGAQTHTRHGATPQVLGGVHSSTPFFFSLSYFLLFTYLQFAPFVLCARLSLTVCHFAPPCSKWLAPAGWVIFQWHWRFHPCSLSGCGVYELTS